MKLGKEYYQQKNVIWLARDLIGKVLVTHFDGVLTSGIICETEAYNGVVDKASHSYGGRRTKRTETMYAAGGVAYVYLCYGIHHLFNIVTHEENTPHAILIRGIEPLEGIPEMLKRKKINKAKKGMGIGPGNVSVCLGIFTHHDKEDLMGNSIWIEDRQLKVIKKNILTGPRVGVDYAGEDALLPYRFRYNF